MTYFLKIFLLRARSTVASAVLHSATYLAAFLAAFSAAFLLSPSPAVAQTPQLIDLMLPLEGLLQADQVYDNERYYLTQAQHNAVDHGDLDGDGYVDMVIGAGGRIETVAPSITVAGEVFVQFGPLETCGVRDLSSPEGVDLTITGSEFQDALGWAVLVADWNDDGQDDLLVASPMADGPSNARPDVGSVYGFLGPLGPGILDVANADLTIHGVADFEPLAYEMVAGDLNHDGVTDLVLGAPGYADKPQGGGEVHVLYGPVGIGTRDLLTAPADVIVSGTGVRDRMGYSIVVDDLTGDGLDDLFIGAMDSNSPPTGVLRGEVFGFFGPLPSAGLFDRTHADVMFYGSGNSSKFGRGIDAADLNQDGIADLAVSVNLYNPEDTSWWSGGAAVWFGPIGANPSPGFPALEADYLVYMANLGIIHDVSMGDVSGDGAPDLILTSPTKAPDGRGVAGEVEIVYGPFSPGERNNKLDPADLVLWGKDGAGQLGRAVDVADFNGDGDAELLMTASFITNIESSGEVYLFDGPHGIPVQAAPAPACTPNATLTLPGSAQSDAEITAVDALANGVSVGPVCLGCGFDPSFSFEFPLQACDNVLRFEATDADGQRGAVTRKTVRDGDGPEFSGCADLEVELAPGVPGAYVTYEPGADDACSGALPSTCDIPSGSYFGLGVTEVSCSATDGCGNVSTCDFRVIVETETQDHTECRTDTFDEAPSLLWSLDTIGDAGLENAQSVAGELHLTGTGTSLYHGPTDDTVFFNQSVNGDFFIEVEVTGIPVDQGEDYRKGGLMVRADTAADAWRVMAEVVPDFNGSGEPAVLFDYRGPGIVDDLASTIQEVTFPLKLGIARQGDDFTVYYAPDGQGWIAPTGGDEGGTITLPGIGDNVLAGVNVSSYSSELPMTMSFDDLSICTPNDIDSPPVVVGCDLAKAMDVVYLLDLSGSMARPFDGSSKLEAARQAMHRLNDTFATLGDGTRGALVTYGLAIGDDEIADATELVSGFTADFGALDAAIAGLDFSAVADSDASPTALGLAAVKDLLQGQGDPANRPVLVWLTDNLPNVDLDLYGPVYYLESEIRALSIDDGLGGFLPRGTVAGLGGVNIPTGQTTVRFNDGEVLADAMWSIELLSEAFPELRILSAVPRDDGSTTAPISEELLDFAAYHAGGGVFGGLDTTALVDAMADLLEAAFCDTEGNGSVEGLVWRDLDGDGVRDLGAGAGEPGVGGVTVELVSGTTVLATATTDTAGRYAFAAVPPGTYEIRLTGLPSELVIPTADPDGVATPDRFTFILGSFDALQGDFGYDDEVPTVDPIVGCLTDDFEDGVLDPAWQSTFLGDATAGTLLESDGSLKISGNGSSLFTTDNAHYLYRHVNGDFRLEVDIESLPVDQGGGFRKAGLMVRDGFSSTAPRLMVQYGPDWPGVGAPILQFSYRASAGAPESSAVWARVQGITLPVRVAIERVGNAFSVAYSSDGGTTWQQPSGPSAVTLPWNNVLLAGLDAVSYDPSVELTAEMDNLSLCAP